MGKFMRPEQAVFLLDERGLEVNATDMVGMGRLLFREIQVGFS